MDLTVLAAAVDLHALPGVQDKAGASMLTTPLATRGARLILQLDPPRHPHLVENAAVHPAAAVDLTALPFKGSPLTHTQRELRCRRGRLKRWFRPPRTGR